MPTYDPEERFSLPMSGEDALRKLLSAEEDEGSEDASEEPVEGDEDQP